MLHTDKYHDFTLSFKKGPARYEHVFEDFVHLRLPVIKVFRNQSNSKVMLVQRDNTFYVLKIFKPKGKLVERLYKSLFRRDYYLNLIKRNDELWNKGMRFQNDVYLLAQRKKTFCTNLYIMLNEYIPGKVLSDVNVLSDGLKQDILTNVTQLHANKLISGDAHKGNFILSEQGLRIIDLSGKKCTRLRIAEDRMALETRFNITGIEKDFSYHLLKTKFRLRRKVKMVKNAASTFFAS